MDSNKISIKLGSYFIFVSLLIIFIGGFSSNCFATHYTITALIGPYGSISPSGTIIVNIGESQTYSITPDTGYHIADVLVDGSSVGPVGSYTFTNVTANRTISASFAINTYSITAQAGANGTITPLGVMSVNYGDSQAYSITPDTGYHIADVLVDGSSVGPVGSYTFSNVTSNRTIRADFSNTYTVSIGKEGTGRGLITSTPAGISCGDVCQFEFVTGIRVVLNIIPDPGSVIFDVRVDGYSQGPVNSVTFSLWEDAHAVMAVLLDPHALPQRIFLPFILVSPGGEI